MGTENKPKYIDADRLSITCSSLERKARKHADYSVAEKYVFVLGVIQNAPTADVQEVKHAYWVDTTAYCGEFTCSICKETCVTNKYKYCPHCGAKMDGKEN